MFNVANKVGNNDNNNKVCESPSPRGNTWMKGRSASSRCADSRHLKPLHQNKLLSVSRIPNGEEGEKKKSNHMSD